MPYLPQQQPPSDFPVLDELEQRVHPAVGYISGVVFAIVMFFYGLDHPRYPLVIFIGPGFVGGLLIVALLKHAVRFLIYTGMVCAAGIGTLWLYEHTTELRQRHTTPTVQAAPASAPKLSPGGLLDDLRKAVQ